MKKILTAAFVAISAVSFSARRADAALTPATTSFQLVWPNYQVPPWSLSEVRPFFMEATVPMVNNKYIPGPAKYDVLVGEVAVFVDSLMYPSGLISEASVLDGGPVLRSLQMRIDGNFVVVSRQLKIKGRWREIPLNYKFSSEITDLNKLIQSGDLQSVTIRFMDGVIVKMKVTVENKPVPADKPKN